MPLRLLEQPRLVAVGAREASAHVPEQFRFEQRVRHAGAIDRHERARAARAVLVHQPRDHFFADAALSGQENLGVGTRGLSQFVLDLPHLHAHRDQRQRFVGKRGVCTNNVGHKEEFAPTRCDSNVS